jgi:chromosome segregation ATPase
MTMANEQQVEKAGFLEQVEDDRKTIETLREHLGSVAKSLDHAQKQRDEARGEVRELNKLLVQSNQRCSAWRQRYERAKAVIEAFFMGELGEDEKGATDGGN